MCVDQALDQPKPGVLLVDDEPVVRSVLATGLRRMGFSVWEASNSREALRVHQAQRAQIAVVLLDLRMPGIDGLGTWELLRENHPQLLCWFMTGDLAEYNEQQLLEQGAEGVLLKPFQFEQLASLLTRQPQRALDP